MLSISGTVTFLGRRPYGGSSRCPLGLYRGRLLSIETFAGTFLQPNVSFCAELCPFGKVSRRSTHLDCCQHPGQFPRRNCWVARPFPFGMLRRCRLSDLNGGLPVECSSRRINVVHVLSAAGWVTMIATALDTPRTLRKCHVDEWQRTTALNPPSHQAAYK
jgi:hypothetical protein